jgi:predicted enzyme related to lactoylglutathione lyase
VNQQPRPVGINHVALEVRNLEEAVAFYTSIFALELSAREPRMAFLRMGDQFLALTEGRTQAPDDTRHFGLVVDDKPAARAALEARGVEIAPGRRLNFRDPAGNLVQVVDYREIQFTKAPSVLRGMGLDGLNKSEAARTELRDAGLL